MFWRLLRNACLKLKQLQYQTAEVALTVEPPYCGHQRDRLKCPHYRGIHITEVGDCKNFGVLRTKRTVRNREVSVRRGLTVQLAREEYQYHLAREEYQLILHTNYKPVKI